MSNSSENGKGNHYNHSSVSEDEEESLSLCDLPLLATASYQEEEEEDGKQREIGDQSEAKTAITAATNDEVGEDFDFGSLVASLDALESEMCAADEIFFRGQILPFRHSISSAASTTAFRSSSLTRSISRSESMDRIASSGFRSSSTASSSRSSRSSSINSSTSAGQPVNHNTNPNHKRSFKARNQFHSFPSPKPYARAPSCPRSSISSTPSANKKSALWELFRLGIVRTPEIELEDLKVRYNKHHNHVKGTSDLIITRTNSSGGSSCDSRSSGGNGKSVNNHSIADDTKNVKKKRRKLKKNEGLNFMNSCRCSVGAVEPEKGDGKVIIVTKRDGAREGEKRQRNKAVDKEREEGRRKRDMSHHRTFEWLKDLSHAVVLNDV